MLSLPPPIEILLSRQIVACREFIQPVKALLSILVICFLSGCTTAPVIVNSGRTLAFTDKKVADLSGGIGLVPSCVIKKGTYPSAEEKAQGQALEAALVQAGYPVTSIDRAKYLMVYESSTKQKQDGYNYSSYTSMRSSPYGNISGSTDGVLSERIIRYYLLYAILYENKGGKTFKGQYLWDCLSGTYSSQGPPKDLEARLAKGVAERLPN